MFEHENIISVNVYGYEDKKIFPLNITTLTVARHHVNLLYITAGEIFLLIKMQIGGDAKNQAPCKIKSQAVAKSNL